jgi:hypothetical protein
MVYVTPYTAALQNPFFSGFSQSRSSRGTVISRQNSTIQANAEFSDVSLGTSPDIVIEM